MDINILNGSNMRLQENERKEQKAVVEKWSQLGLLEGLGSQSEKMNLVRLLENQAGYVNKTMGKALLQEASGMAAGDVQGFAAISFPIVRRLFGKLIANDLVSVQAMKQPTGLIFYLDFVYGDELGGTTTAAERFGNQMGGSQSIYGTNKVGSGVTEGVSTIGDTAEDLGGPYNNNGLYSAPTASATLPSASAGDAKWKWSAFALTSSMTETQRRYIKWDEGINSKLVTDAGVAATHGVAFVSAPKGNFTNANFNALQAFHASSSALATLGELGADAKMIRRLTRLDPDNSSNLLFTIVGPTGSSGVILASASAGAALDNNLVMEYPRTDVFGNVGSDSLGAIVGDTPWGLEYQKKLPEIDIKVNSTMIQAESRKLKAKWSDELRDDLQAWHQINAEAELSNMLTEYMSLEINQELLQDLIKSGTAATYYWSRMPSKFVARETGIEVGASAKAPDFTGTPNQWYEGLIEVIEDVSSKIHRKTLMGGANFIVTSPEVAVILEATAGYMGNIMHDDDRGDMGVKQGGSIKKRYDIYVDPYFRENLILVGRRGQQFLDSGYVYAPYVAFESSQIFHDPEDGSPRRIVRSRFGKKMVRPDMYGKVFVLDLKGGSGQ